MNWQDLSTELSASISFQNFPQSFRNKIISKLPNCSNEQLEQLKNIIDLDRENYINFMDESKKFQTSLQKKILGLQEIVEDQEMLDNFEAQNGPMI